jgi:hypothetical protein
MKSLRAPLWLYAACVVTAAAGAAEVSDESTTSLQGAGALGAVREPLTAIFQFKIENGKLSLDRDAWAAAAEKIEKDEAAAAEVEAKNLPKGMAPNSPEALRYRARQLERQADQLERQTRMGGAKAPPLHTLLRQVQARAANAPRGRTGGSSGFSSSNGRQVWQMAFESGGLSGQLRTDGDGEQLILRESSKPRRMLELVTDGDGFRIQLVSLDGDSILLRQEPGGQFSVAAIIAGKVVVERSPSFVLFLQKNRELAGKVVLPALASAGVRPILSPDDEIVRKTALALLLRPREATDEGQQLLAQLDDDHLETRERARRLLANLYDQYKDLIERTIEDKSAPAEVRAQLTRIVSEESDSKLVRQTIAALNLLNDPQYIVSFLEDAQPRESVGIARHLESITGKKLGTDAAAWKEWLYGKDGTDKSQ